MNITIHIHNRIIDITADSKQSLAQALWLSGKLQPPPLCSGLGRCGQCKVLFISPSPTAQDLERSLLSPEDVNRCVRLACRHQVQTLTPNAEGKIEISILDASISEHSIKILDSAPWVKLAVDLGTTSLQWQALSPEGEVIAKGEQINPQMGAGSDIISRLAFAMRPQGTEKLANLVIQALQNIIEKLPPVHEICIAANTAMTSIFLQKDIKPLALAPYSLPTEGDNIEQIKDLAPVYIPPQLAPFVGGDISAGYLALMESEQVEFPFIFTDLGTNGEFILAHDAKHAHITSVPLGPALEGIGLALGHMAHGASGIVSSVRLSPMGLEPTTLDGALPNRICGTGYLSIVHCLLKAGIVQESGQFCSQSEINNPLGAKLFKNLERQSDEYIFKLWPHIAGAEHMYLSSTDIEEILKVKAAFSLAMQELLTTSKLKHTELKALYLAGAMGMHAQAEDLEALGFIPCGMSNRLVRMGNTSLEGAKILLTKPQKRTWLNNWNKHITHIQLAEHTTFITKYMQHMLFSYTG